MFCRLRIFALALLLAMYATPVQAHPHHSHTNFQSFSQTVPDHGFWSGAVHPFTGIDHMLAMVAVGVLSVQVGGRALFWGPLSFLGGVSLGGLLGSLFHLSPGAQAAICVSLICMGMALAFRRVPPHVYLFAVFAFFGAFHGIAHGEGKFVTGQDMDYMVGFVAGSAALHAVGLAIGVVFKQSQNTLVANMARVSGAGIAAAGLFLMFMS
ncbi:HupE/UreJ family protein [Schlesneria sp. T3-172]|uniref:HupE/UreJ family protein n=1 Tax=Schlesneria TaxID=656899 RepID=UPI002EE9584E